MIERPVAAHDFDVIVVGAGAGGAAAALYLTQAGLRVLVIDQARLPRDKPCGGAIPSAVLARLPFALDPVIRARPSAARLTLPGLPPADAALPGRPVIMVSRREFDAFVLAQSGAEVAAGRRVTGVVEAAGGVRVQAGDRAWTARYLVGADGAASMVARWVGLCSRRCLCPGLETEVPLDDGALAERYGNRVVFALGALRWGYGWVFPRGDCLSVGVARFRPGRVDLRGALSRHADRLGLSLDGAPVRGHPIPVYRCRPWPLWWGRPQERLSTRRCVLVGDAAGLANPFTGEGIRHAIDSARLAANGIARDDLTGYEAAVWREIGHSLATAGLVAQLFYRQPWLAYRFGIRNPATLRHLIAVQAGQFNYQGLGRRVMLLTVAWLLGRPEPVFAGKIEN